MLRVLDLFSAAAGGWSLGLHRAGFQTVAACEAVAWRRALYSQNNPGVLIYNDVCTLTADRLVRDLGFLPDIVVGSPPCQDISSANTKGKGVDGENPASSSKQSASSEKSDLVGSLLRTAIASELVAMTRSPQRWKHTTTTAGRSWWALEMPAAPISVSEHGSLAWTPTPRSHKGGLSDSHGWTPTPTGQTGRYRGQIGGGGAGARKRVEELAILWAPTPTAANYGSNVALGPDGKRTGKKRSSLGSLASSVGLSGRQTLAAIYEHMMGFPVGWLSSAAKLTETPSAPKSRKP